jgi:hypothetical protein
MPIIRIPCEGTLLSRVELVLNSYSSDESQTTADDEVFVAISGTSCLPMPAAVSKKHPSYPPDVRSRTPSSLPVTNRRFIGHYLSHAIWPAAHTSGHLSSAPTHGTWYNCSPRNYSSQSPCSAHARLGHAAHHRHPSTTQCRKASCFSCLLESMTLPALVSANQPPAAPDQQGTPFLHFCLRPSTRAPFASLVTHPCMNVQRLQPPTQRPRLPNNNAGQRKSRPLVTRTSLHEIPNQA